MKEINIAKTIASKRREKDITQDELAGYMGVSKASVSKWETGQSYPDIAFLPQLAAYFNISIDDLMGYSPQMTKEDIKKLYRKLSSDFATLKFDDVLAECEKIIKKYYSCFPLILQMAVLLMNHHMLSPSPAQQKEILEQAIKMCRRVQSAGEDVWLVKEAFMMEATCYLLQGDAQKILAHVGEEIRPISSDIEMQASAYQIMGKTEKSKEALQIAMYQHLVNLLADAGQYLLLNSEDNDKFEETLKRALAVAKIYNADRLHPNTMLQIYLAGAQIYCQKKMYDQAVEMFKLLADVYLNHLLPGSLHGDAYFDQIDNWFETFDLGNAAPRNEAVIKESMAAVTENPAFAGLFENPEYIKIVKKIKSF